jgi:hypothetical protein
MTFVRQSFHWSIQQILATNMPTRNPSYRISKWPIMQTVRCACLCGRACPARAAVAAGVVIGVSADRQGPLRGVLPRRAPYRRLVDRAGTVGAAARGLAGLSLGWLIVEVLQVVIFVPALIRASFRTS